MRLVPLRPKKVSPYGDMAGWVAAPRTQIQVPTQCFERRANASNAWRLDRPRTQNGWPSLVDGDDGATEQNLRKAEHRQGEGGLRGVRGEGRGEQAEGQCLYYDRHEQQGGHVPPGGQGADRGASTTPRSTALTPASTGSSAVTLDAT